MSAESNPTTDAAAPNSDDDLDQADSEQAVLTTFDRAVSEGRDRMDRTLPALLATGSVGGIDVGIGVLALLVVLESTGNHLLAALAFPIGLILVSLARSELFTEDFLLPVTALVARRATPWDLLRLWSGTLLSNLVGGWLVMALVIAALANLGHVAVEVGAAYPAQGIGRESFASALVGGMVITLWTWTERATESVPARIFAGFATGFVLASSPLNHAVVSSLEMFAALIAGAPFGYADWLGITAWVILGNMIGGIGLVTVLRLVQVGQDKILATRAEADADADADESTRAALT